MPVSPRDICSQLQAATGMMCSYAPRGYILLGFSSVARDRLEDNLSKEGIQSAALEESGRPALLLSEEDAIRCLTWHRERSGNVKS